jgi:hypothetical protein
MKTLPKTTFSDSNRVFHGWDILHQDQTPRDLLLQVTYFDKFKWAEHLKYLPAVFDVFRLYRVIQCKAQISFRPNSGVCEW